ncbi:MAG: sugar phosphate nucleotidyltransferase, partial [Actinomycetota bacterium]
MSNPNPADVPVVILCGGYGTRIREASEKLPKPLINIGNQPILWHIMKLYGHHGFRRFVLCLGYKAWDIKQYFLRYEEMASDLKVHLGTDTTTEFLGRETLDDWEVSLMDTGLDTGTGGRVAMVASQLDADYFMLTYGDGVADVALGDQLQRLAESDHIGLVTGVNPSSRYGELGVDESGTITT